MALRELIDADGTAWQIWDVHPTHALSPPRSGRERRQAGGGAPPDERRRHSDRRHLALTPGLERGWLCFESGTEKRRLLYIPADWETCDDRALGDYLSRAVPVRRRLTERGGEDEAEPLPYPVP